MISLILRNEVPEVAVYPRKALSNTLQSYKHVSEPYQMSSVVEKKIILPADQKEYQKSELTSCTLLCNLVKPSIPNC
jgi:hypothetical protein